MRFFTVIFHFTLFFANYCSSQTTPKADDFSNVEISILERALQEASEDMGMSTSDNHTLTRSFIPRDGNSLTKLPIVAEIIGMDSNRNLRAFDILVNRYGIPRSRALRLLRRRPSTSEYCIAPTFCDPFKSYSYRSIDGTCNNLNNPTWGAALTTFKRLLNADYNDDFGEPRGGILARRLPNVRRISTTLHPDLIHPDQTITNMVPQMGQFLDHDLSLTPEADRKCCSTDRGYVDCWPITVPEDDPVQTTRCMDFTRSTVFCFPTDSGKREQFNVLTAYADLSQVYGSDDDRAQQLRSFSKGRLLLNDGNSKFLPTVQQVQTLTNTHIDFRGKFLAGDERVNEMPALACMHTLWVREHNRVAALIDAANNFNWNDEDIYQAARRLTIAEWQNIIYGEFLPVVLGNRTMRRYGLSLNDQYSTYNENLDATIFHSFATAAYRFGHTLINGIVQLYRGLNKVGQYNIRDNFFESEQVERNQGEGCELIWGGLMIQNAQAYDPFVTNDLTNHLLKNRTEKFGGDLIARNLQRGREHGIAPYNAFRQLCNLTPLTTWSSRPREILPATWIKLGQLYNSPADIDLFSGGISEVPVTGAVSGATFNCIKGLQFRNTKFGDRFFFTHEPTNITPTFTKPQLEAIRKRTLGDIICQNSNLQQTPLNVFRIISPINPMIPCNSTLRSRLPLE